MSMAKKGARIPRICHACGAGLQIERKPTGCDTYNELYLTLAGGYGSFVDDITHQGGLPYVFTLCEACAVRLCREFKFRAPFVSITPLLSANARTARSATRGFSGALRVLDLSDWSRGPLKNGQP